MKTNSWSLKWPAMLLALAAGAGVAAAATATVALKVGDPAPKLQTGAWVQGEPVKEFEKGKAYIVEFWATWCGPCRESIPHLNAVHEKFKGRNLVVIGQDCTERDDKLVAPFVKRMGEKMTYRVALDDKTTSLLGTMADNWMSASGSVLIPTAFVVDTNGLIAWIGHPMLIEDQLIEDVLSGKFDTKKEAMAIAERERAGEEILRKNEEKINALGPVINAAMNSKDWATASAKADELEQLLPEEMRAVVGGLRFNILIGKKDYPAAYKLVLQISNAHKSNAQLQNQLAWQILTDPAIETRDLAAAETLAKRANDAARGQDAGIIDTLARAKFMQGKKDEAIALEEEALTVAKMDEMTPLREVLNSYKKGELPDLK